jgi:hypothetical protein
VRVLRQKFTLEDAISSQACSLEAKMRVANNMPLGNTLLLPVGTVNSVQTLKVAAKPTAAAQAAEPLFLFYAPHIVHEPLQVPKNKYDEFAFIPFERRRRYHAMVNYMVRFFFPAEIYTRGCHWSHACSLQASRRGNQWHSFRVFTTSYRSHFV